jgi:NAD(P)-dependent dehydrogenase (short-subunit alcohol dehydrogenase family)
MTYRGKVVVVTGGGSGMGRAAARTFAQAGATVALIDVNEAGMAETASGHDNIVCYPVDITDYAALEVVTGNIEASHGPVDRVYNCAAIMPLGRVLEQDVAVIHKLMAINYGGFVNIAKTLLPGMVARGQGDFVSFASMAGIIPGLLLGGYNASKAAVVTLTEVLYHENRNSGVRFACVCPPPVATPLLQQGRDTVWPKMLAAQEGKELQPQQVIDTIEVALERGEFFVFPGKGTRMGYIMRRWFPNYIWNYSHKLEGF